MTHRDPDLTHPTPNAELVTKQRASYVALVAALREEFTAPALEAVWIQMREHRYNTSSLGTLAQAVHDAWDVTYDVAKLMPTGRRTCFIAVCADCGDEYENGEFTPHWLSLGEAIDDAMGSGEWWRHGDDLLCYPCKDKPHAFVKSELWADDCDRCSNPADEHEDKL